jgi:hypothetical protein
MNPIASSVLGIGRLGWVAFRKSLGLFGFGLIFLALADHSKGVLVKECMI